MKKMHYLNDNMVRLLQHLEVGIVHGGQEALAPMVVVHPGLSQRLV